MRRILPSLSLVLILMAGIPHARGTIGLGLSRPDPNFIIPLDQQNVEVCLLTNTGDETLNLTCTWAGHSGIHLSPNNLLLNPNHSREVYATFDFEYETDANGTIEIIANVPESTTTGCTVAPGHEFFCTFKIVAALPTTNSPLAYWTSVVLTSTYKTIAVFGIIGIIGWVILYFKEKEGKNREEPIISP